ncbi:unnamed protein product [Nezara viridula]|uniref:Uncharacterized protein n=1 Tax=Nezara viridula TaxID=85310 RepID=A0A9P0HGW5_NEZVI|nr:unnamed protein product [Nezara viridula]
MFPTNSQELGSRYHIHKSLHQIVEELTTPGKILIQFNGWRNVCQTLDYIFGHCYDIFDELSGISLEFEGLSQVVGYVYSAENLKKKALLGGTIITTTSFYTLDNERNGELLEGLDDLDRNLKKMKVWGCDFVILQIKLKCYKPFGARRVPFDNSEYFGIFSATTQALGCLLQSVVLFLLRRAVIKLLVYKLTN